MGNGRPPLGIQCRFPGPQLRQVACNGICCLGGLRLAALQAGQLLPGVPKLLFVDLDLGLLSRQTFPVCPIPVFEALQLPTGCIFRILNGSAQHLKLLFLALKTQNLVLCLPKLVPGSGQLEFHLVVLPLELLKPPLLLLTLGQKLLFLGRQLFQFIGS